MASSERDRHRPGERFGDQDGVPLRQRTSRRPYVLVERQLSAVANDGSGEVVAECLQERREQLARAIQPWKQDEMRCEAQ